MTKIVKPLRSGQVTIPADFRAKLGIGTDTLLQISLLDGELRIKPVRATETAAGSPWFRKLYDSFAPIRKEASEYNEGEINTAINTAVKAIRKGND